MVVTRSTPEGWRNGNDTLLKDITGLRFEGADVTLALSQHEEDVIQISSDILKASSGYFKAGLSGRWTSQDSSSLNFQRYGLTLDSQRDGYTLVRGVSLYNLKLGLCLTETTQNLPDADPISEDEEKQTLECNCYITLGHYNDCPHWRSAPLDFYSSAYGIVSPEYLPLFLEPLYLSQAHRHAVRDHKILFASIMEIDFELDGLSTVEAAVCLANVCAYAIFYQMLPAVAKAVRQKMENLEGLWEHLAGHPEFYLVLGSVLRSEPIFTDAVRHVVGAYDASPMAPTDWAELRTESSATLFILYKKRAELDKAVRNLEDELRQLCYYTPYWAFFDTRNPKWDTEKDKAGYLARGVFTEWLNIKLSSNIFHKRGRPVYEELTKAAQTGNLRLFRKHTPSRLLEMFELKKDSKTDTGPKKMIEKELRDLLNRSATLIRDFIDSEWTPRAKFDKMTSRACYPYFTNLRFEKHNLPWAGEIPWESDLTAAEASEQASDED